MTIVEFIKRYLSALGIAGPDIEEYAAKVIFTAAGSVLLGLDESDTDHAAFSAALEQVQRGSESPFALLDRAFPDGRHYELFRKEVVRTLLDTTVRLSDALDEKSRVALSELVGGLK